MLNAIKIYAKKYVAKIDDTGLSLLTLTSLAFTGLTTTFGVLMGMIHRKVNCPYIVDDNTIATERAHLGGCASDDQVRIFAQRTLDARCGIGQGAANGALLGMLPGLTTGATFLISYGIIQCRKRNGAYRLAEVSPPSPEENDIRNPTNFNKPDNHNNI